MRPIQRAIERLPFLLSDVLRPSFLAREYKVFLCGNELSSRFLDIRRQIQWWLESRVGTTAFLGEDIPELLKPKVASDHLSIETKAAQDATLIVMFLGSPGTIAELTAFALNESIRSKLLVFNKTQYKDQKTFVNLGPLRLLEPGSVVWIDTFDEQSLESITKAIDASLSRLVFDPSQVFRSEISHTTFEVFATYATTYALYPVDYRSMADACALHRKLLDSALRSMFKSKLLTKLDDLYWPAKEPKYFGVVGDIEKMMARVRLEAMANRILDINMRRNYRLCIG